MQQVLAAAAVVTLAAVELAYDVPALELDLAQPNEPLEDLSCLRFDLLQRFVRLVPLQGRLVHDPSGSELGLARRPPEQPEQKTGQLECSS